MSGYRLSVDYTILFRKILGKGAPFAWALVVSQSWLFQYQGAWYASNGVLRVNVEKCVGAALIMASTASSSATAIQVISVQDLY